MVRKGASHKQKFYLLIAGLIAILILAYNLAISKTWDEYHEYRQLKEKLTDLSSLNMNLKSWRDRNQELDSKLGGEMIIAGFHESLLNTVGKFCEENDITLSEFSEPFEGIDGGYAVETIILTMQGGYKPLLKLVHHLETNFKGGRIASVQFIKEKNYRKNREELFLKMYVQKVKKKGDEKY